MGRGNWSDMDWSKHSATTQTQTRAQIFTQANMSSELDPTKVKFRESRDSDQNPNSTPIILCVDQTGSMGVLAEKIIKTGLGVIMSALYDRRPVSNPHIMCMCVGDSNSDDAPLQVTKFEATVEPIVAQVKKMFLEGNGGGNGGESYALAHLFTAAKTKCDGIKKGRKGWIFTIGDESPHLKISKEHAKKFLDIDCPEDVHVPSLIEHLGQDWNIFHLIVKPVSTQNVVGNWRNILGERAIVVTDIDKLAEGIVSIIELTQGAKPADVIKSWNGNTSIVVGEVCDQLVKV